MTSKVLTGLVLASLLFSGNAASQSSDDTFYRYKDENGRIVIDTSIPPDRVAFGYEVLNEHGRVIETVARRKTAAEIAARSEEEKQKEAEEAARKKQEEYDLSLLRRYSFVSDIEFEKERKIKELQVRASILKGNLNGVRAELEVEYDRAAYAEKQGREVPEKVQERITALETKITTTEELLSKRQQAVQDLRIDYIRAIERFKQLQALRNK